MTTRHRPNVVRAAGLAVALAVTAPLAATTAAAAPATPSAAPTTTIDAAPLQADLDAVVDAGAVGVVGHVTSGAAEWSGAAGHRDVAGGTDVRPGDVARVASVTKAMVATLVMQEVDAGRWTLDTTVDDVLPGLLPGRGDVTLEQLLSHRSGLPEYLTPFLLEATTNEAFIDVLRTKRTDEELVAAALSQPWLFEPGADFSYSNTNYVVAGMMLEETTNRPMHVLLEQRVFRPAGMDDAYYPTRGATFRGRAHVPDVAIIEGDRLDLARTTSSIFSAAGAVVASAEDIADFYRALFAGRLVSDAALATMTEPRSTTTLVYGLGIYQGVDPCPGPDGQQQPIYGHDGASFGTFSVVFTSADGERQVAIAAGGRQYVEAPPAVAPLNTFLVDGLAADCELPVAPQSRQRSLDSLEDLPERLSADVDAAVGDGLVRR
ncbi:beta-lactamase family protein [Phycicoccus sp. BSK3Z-2]|uniref:Beta-lactamase family protein n=1 Tax=Phycicoccus avicenniae TaxID=2828860 RepID=A0A941D5L4_9MICO|nr:serine hydrolase domain-containing protein [Phycicoccus avicenniae]MBR7741881.1 beta-lactamase family protein [Phycicoccus avicenniae]